MIETLGKLGLSGGIGFLLGLGVLTWVRPETTPGRVALLVIAIVACMVLGRIIELMRKSHHPLPLFRQIDATTTRQSRC